jgi:hypothetical protein
MPSVSFASRPGKTCPGYAHDAAGLGDVLQSLRQIQQSHLVLDDALIYKTHARLLLVCSMIA